MEHTVLHRSLLGHNIRGRMEAGSILYPLYLKKISLTLLYMLMFSQCETCIFKKWISLKEN